MPTLALEPWVRFALACSTVVVQPDQTFIPPSRVENGAAVMVSSRPWEAVGTAVFPDCVSLVAAAAEEEKEDQDSFLKTVQAVSRIRLDARLILSTFSEKDLNYLGEYERLNFEAYVVRRDFSGKVLGHRRFSPYDPSSGRSLHRSVTASYSFIFPYIFSPGPPPIGMDPEMLGVLQDKLGFRARVKFFRTFNELFPSLASDNATSSSDLCIGHPNLILQRLRLGLDVSPTLAFRATTFSLPHPKPRDTFYTAFYPFSKEVWAGVALSVAAVATSLTFLNAYFGLPTLTFASLSVSYVPLASESVPDRWFSSRERSARHFSLLLLWLLLGNLLAQAYRSNLLAGLVKVEYEEQPETFQDVLDGRCEMYIVRGSVFDILLRQSPFERHRRVIQECVRENGGYFEGFDIPQWMIDRILNGHAVGLASEDLMAGSRHLYHLGKETLGSGNAGWYYRLKLPLRREIDWGLQAMIDTGLIKEIRRRSEWILSRPSRDAARSEKTETRSALDLSQFLAMLLVLLLGTSASALAAFPAEVAMAWWGRRKGREEVGRTRKRSSAFGLKPALLPQLYGLRTRRRRSAWSVGQEEMFFSD